jgi:hypothetical protein
MANEVEPGPEREALLQLAYHWDRLVAYNIDKNSKENKGHANTRALRGAIWAALRLS